MAVLAVSASPSRFMGPGQRAWGKTAHCQVGRGHAGAMWGLSPGDIRGIPDDLRCIASVPSFACRCSHRETKRRGPRRRPRRVRRHRRPALACSGDGPRVGADRGRPLRNRCRAAAAPGRRGAQPGGGPAPAAPAAGPAPVVATRHRRRVRRIRHPRGRAAHRPADDRADAGRLVPAVQRGHGPAVVGPPAELDHLGRGPGRHRRHRLVRRAGLARRRCPGRVRACRAGRCLPGHLRGAARRRRPRCCPWPLGWPTPG
jgi:hypothetical protein